MEVSEELQKEYDDYYDLVEKETAEFPHVFEKFEKIMRRLKRNKIAPHEAVRRVVETFAPYGYFGLIIKFNAFMEEGASITYSLTPAGIPSFKFVAPEIQGSLIAYVNLAGEVTWSRGTS